MIRYDPPSALAVVTCYYNPERFRSKRTNYDYFLASMEGVPVVTVECAFGDAPFELPERDGLIQIRTPDVMWQKERLLNLAVERLPTSIETVAWLDADVLFENPAWAVETEAALENAAVVQPFSLVSRLSREATAAVMADAVAGEADQNWRSFAAVYRESPNAILAGRFDLHGHTGFAWAARREVLTRNGLYDACISGSGDHMMAHAFAGDWESTCIARIFAENEPHLRHFQTWAAATYRDVRARVRCVPGRLLHLWHGDTENRRYVVRNQELAAFGFDPTVDLQPDPSGAWSWASNRADLRRWAVEYYQSRREDG